MKKLASMILILIILAGVTLAGCTSTGGNAAPEPTAKPASGVARLVIGTTNAVTDLNVNDYYLGIFKARTSHQGLIALNPDGSYAPCLAESWESPDASTFVFHLQRNATWHDGLPVTAKDIKFNLEYFPQKIAEYKQHWGLISSVETPDDYTVIIHLKSPNSNFLVNLLVMRAVPEHIYRDIADPAKFNDVAAMIGCGPYKFEKFDKQAGTLTFTAYDGYWGGTPSVKSVEFRIFKNQDTMIMALKKGEIDTTYMYSNGISYYYVPGLLDNPDVGFMMIPFTGVSGALFFNANKTPYDNATFRKAVSYALDYEELKNLFTAGYGSTPNAGFLPNGTYNFKDTPQMARNLNKSKELLDTIGFKDVDGDGLRETPDGKKFQPEIFARTDIADYPRLAEMIKKYLKDVGLDSKIRLADMATTTTTLNTAKTHELALSRTTPWGMMTWAGYGSCYFDPRNIGYTMTKDPKYLALVDRMFNATDEATQRQIAFEMQDYYASEMPAVALYWSDLIQPYNKKYAGWVNDPMYGIMSYGTFYGLHEV
ncbi:MAG: putative ABC transporter periplasmic-binding protein [Methanocella sp. PtaU1.Bin125]|nr:MAG: putative ABC transporter periplasmic-binding protein [Methanocella sp. PtaU1.Bin125]